MKQVLIMLLLASFVSAESIGIRGIGYNEVPYPGEEVFFVAVRNLGEGRLEDVKVTVWSPEIDVFAVSDSYDIRKGSQASFVVTAFIPNVPEGYYLLRFTIEDDSDESRSYYRHIYIRSGKIY